MSNYLDVDPTKPQGEDEGSPENEEGVRIWLVDNTDGMTLAERITYAEALGRDDIIEALGSQPK